MYTFILKQLWITTIISLKNVDVYKLNNKLRLNTCYSPIFVYWSLSVKLPTMSKFTYLSLFNTIIIREFCIFKLVLKK